METKEIKIPYKIIIEVAEVHGCKTHSIGEKWILDKESPVCGTEMHEMWPSPICAALLYDIYPKVLAMRYGAEFSWHQKWEKGDFWVATCWDELARVVVHIKRVLE